MRKPQRVPRRRLVASAKPLCCFDKVRVDWVAWATIQIYGARDAIADACTTSSGVERSANQDHVRRRRCIAFVFTTVPRDFRLDDRFGGFN